MIYLSDEFLVLLFYRLFYMATRIFIEFDPVFYSSSGL